MLRSVKKMKCFTNPQGRWMCLLPLLATPLVASSVRIYITDAAGDRVQVIDPATNKVVDEIRDIEIPSGVDFSKDKKTIYFSCEGEKTLDFVDRETGKI